ncbi:MAG: hypothetical protein IJT50_14615 [Lentisphaeria bacterium]|nr:hypothetical protein [Lentisphaeria bacterium]
MSYVIIEPLDIRIRRAISKLLKRTDPKVVRFDREARRAFTASHPWLEGSEDGNKGGNDA